MGEMNPRLGPEAAGAAAKRSAALIADCDLVVKADTPSHHQGLWRAAGLAIDGVLLLVIAFELYLRFSDAKWNQGTALHPDEYGLTGTLTQLRIPTASATTSTPASRRSARI